MACGLHSSPAEEAEAGVCPPGEDGVGQWWHSEGRDPIQSPLQAGSACSILSEHDPVRHPSRPLCVTAYYYIVAGMSEAAFRGQRRSDNALEEEGLTAGRATCS